MTGRRGERTRGERRGAREPGARGQGPGTSTGCSAVGSVSTLPSPLSSLLCLPPSEGHHQERAGAAGRVQQPRCRLAGVADLIEHVSGQPVGRIVFAKLPPQRPREEVFVKRLEQIAVAVGMVDARTAVGGPMASTSRSNQPVGRPPTAPLEYQENGLPGSKIARHGRPRAGRPPG